jgi:SAM-dependent methyltransferase
MNEKKQIQTYEKIYGEFDKENYNSHILYNLPSESAFYWGELIKWSTDIRPQCVLFVGENKSTAAILKDTIKARKVLTTGLSDVDYKWNFEEQRPVIDHDIDLVVSQAIFEHLLNPYKHIQDLADLVSPGGFILIHTAIPGFLYHRFPIDTLRFFPDWFEEMAKRLQLKVIKKRIQDGHIFYMYQKSAS